MNKSQMVKCLGGCGCKVPQAAIDAVLAKRKAAAPLAESWEVIAAAKLDRAGMLISHHSNPQKKWKQAAAIIHDANDGRVEKLETALRDLVITRHGLHFAYHRNVEKGDYLECRYCEGESPGHDVRSASVVHKDGCDYAAARRALNGEGE